MQRKGKNKNKSLVILGSLLILSSLSLISFNVYSRYKDKKDINNALDNFYIEEKEIETDVINTEVEEVKEEKKETPINYIAVLRIPKINLKRGLVEKSSPYNNIKYNIMIHSESDSPDVEGGNVILVAHSGSSSVSFFKKLDKLELDDLVYLDYNGSTYGYKIIDIYDIEKTGKAAIRKNTSKSSITLITCRHGTNKQIVIIGEIV